MQFQDQAVGLGLEHAQALVELAHFLEPHFAQFVHHFHHHAGGLLQHRRARGEIDAFEAMPGQREAVGEALDLLGDLVQRRGQRFDVLALDRGDEAVDQRLADLVRGDPLALARQLERVQRDVARRVLQHFVQRLGAVVRGHGGFVEQDEELLSGTEDGLEGEHGGRPKGCRTMASLWRDYDGFMTWRPQAARAGRWRHLAMMAPRPRATYGRRHPPAAPPAPRRPAGQRHPLA